MITVFSWGYWGWGSSTMEFVRRVDAIEKSRGKRTPLFADIRLSRSVRAAGFRDDEFARTAGKSRYTWFRKLGNLNVATGRTGSKIADPSAIADLLDLVRNAHQEKRRVIFFCACEQPSACHRAKVANMLLKFSEKEGRRLSVAEWPGGSPVSVELRVPARVVRSMLDGGERLPLDNLSPAAATKWMSIPWGSPIELKAETESVAVLAGPAKFSGGRWHLPVIGPQYSKLADTIASLKPKAESVRKSQGYSIKTV